MFERLKSARKAKQCVKSQLVVGSGAEQWNVKIPPTMPTADVCALITAGDTLEGDSGGDKSLEQRQRGHAGASFLGNLVFLDNERFLLSGQLLKRRFSWFLSAASFQ